MFQTSSPLRDLDITDSGLIGSIPTEVAKISRLQHFCARGGFDSDTWNKWGGFEGSAPDFGPNSMMFALRIEHNNFEGTIPTTYGRLSSLQDLRFGNNSMRGSIPSEIARISSLWAVFATYNSLQGHLPEEMFKLQNLAHISLRWNSFSGSLPTVVGKMQPILESFFLDGSSITGILPTELGLLSLLKGISCLKNRFQGSIPSEIGRLSVLNDLDCANNQLEGGLPSEIFALLQLTTLDLSYNRLMGKLPTEVLLLKNLTTLALYANDLAQSVPSELGRLESCQYIQISYNRFTGRVPQELFGLTKLYRLHIADNSLVGSLVPEIGRLSETRHLTISFNSFTGTLPSAIGALQKLNEFYLGGNPFSGSIPLDIGRFRNLEDFSLRDCSFSGSLPSEIGLLKELRLVLLSNNRFAGRLPTEVVELHQLQVLALQTNKVKGQLPSELGNLRNLKEVALRYNKFHGSIPSEFNKLESLSLLLLDNNKFTGGVPNFSGMERLHAVTLHSNKMDGPLTRLTQTPASLGLLTLHGNRFSGIVPPFLLQMWSSDSARYRDRGGYPCEEESIYDCKDEAVLRACPVHCAQLNGSAPVKKSVVLTLHRNVLSCKLPVSISSHESHVRSVVLMGNFFDDPRVVDWVSPHEKGAEFLYTTEDSWTQWFFANTVRGGPVFGGFLFLGYSLGKLRRQIVTAAFVNNVDSIVLLNRLVLFDLRHAPVFFSCMLPLCLLGAHGYYECGRKGARFTMAYFGASPISEWLATVLWTAWSCFAICFTKRATDGDGVIARLKELRGDSSSYRESFLFVTPPLLLRLVAWLLWLIPLFFLSIPSLVYSVSTTLPENNWIFAKLGKHGTSAFLLIPQYAPLLSTIINYLVLPDLTSAFATMTGSQRITLAMHVWTSSSWLMATLSIVALHENCAGGWKYFWDVCYSVGLQGEMEFDETVGNMMILHTRRDICFNNDNKLNLKRKMHDIADDDRCPRAIIDTLSPTLYGSLWCWAFINPLALLMKRLILVKAGRFDLMQSRLRWKRNSDVAVLARVIEIMFVWGAVIPAIVPLGCVAIVTNLIVVQLRAHDLGSMSSMKDDLRLSFLRFHLIGSTITGCGFQVWFAYSFGMHGRHCLLACLSTLFALCVYFEVDVWQYIVGHRHSDFSFARRHTGVTIELGAMDCAGRVSPDQIRATLHCPS